MSQLVSLTGKINGKKVLGQIAFSDFFLLLLTFFMKQFTIGHMPLLLLMVEDVHFQAYIRGKSGP